MRMTLDGKQIFHNSLNCYICQKGLGTDRVRDHCHFTGRFTGAVALEVCEIVLKFIFSIHIDLCHQV